MDFEFTSSGERLFRTRRAGSVTDRFVDVCSRQGVIRMDCALLCSLEEAHDRYC